VLRRVPATGLADVIVARMSLAIGDRIVVRARHHAAFIRADEVVEAVSG
jgi:hypothetical protein